MKSSKAEAAAVAAAELEAKKALAEAKREAAAKRKRERELAKDIWYQTTKVVVPAWFGNCDVADGLKLAKTFSPAALLALVHVGKAGRDTSETSSRSACEVSMQMALRPSGFDRQESRELAEAGFYELGVLKLLKKVKDGTDTFPYNYYVLSAKGQKWFDLIERVAGCAPEKAA